MKESIHEAVHILYNEITNLRKIIEIQQNESIIKSNHYLKEILDLEILLYNEKKINEELNHKLKSLK